MNSVISKILSKFIEMELGHLYHLRIKVLFFPNIQKFSLWVMNKLLFGTLIMYSIISYQNI